MGFRVQGLGCSIAPSHLLRVFYAFYTTYCVCVCVCERDSVQACWHSQSMLQGEVVGDAPRSAAEIDDLLPEAAVAGLWEHKALGPRLDCWRPLFPHEQVWVQLHIVGEVFLASRFGSRSSARHSGENDWHAFCVFFCVWVCVHACECGVCKSYRWDRRVKDAWETGVQVGQSLL